MKRVLFLLGHMTDLDIEWLINNGRKQAVRADEVLIRRNEELGNLYIVLSGRLSIRDGILNIEEIASVGPGEVLGEMSLIESRPPSVNVSATTDSEVYVISRELIEERMKKDVSFKANLYYSLALFLSDRLRKTTSQLGYGNPEEEDVIDSLVLDSVGQAGSRFDLILKKFSEV